MARASGASREARKEGLSLRAIADAAGLTHTAIAKILAPIATTAAAALSSSDCVHHRIVYPQHFGHPLSTLSEARPNGATVPHTSHRRCPPNPLTDSAMDAAISLPVLICLPSSALKDSTPTSDDFPELFDETLVPRILR